MKSKIQKISKILILALPFLVMGQSFFQISSASPSYIDSYDISVDPKGTYLNTSNDVVYRKDSNHNFILDSRGRRIVLFTKRSPTAFFLNRLNFNTEFLYIASSGKFKYELDRYASGGRGREAGSMLGLFVDSAGRYLRYGNGSESDISVTTSPDETKDFLINESPKTGSKTCTIVEVPRTANRILFSPSDIFFSDNSKGSQKYEAHIMNTAVSIGYANPMQVIFAPQLSVSGDYYEDPYDLVANKPFAIRVGFHKLYKTSKNEIRINPVLRVEKKVKSGKFKKVSNINYKCSNKEGKNISSKEVSANCSFLGSHFTSLAQPMKEYGGGKYHGVYNQVFRLEDGLPEGYYRITVDLKANPNKLYCHAIDRKLANTFEIEVHKTYSPKIGLARVDCDTATDTDCTTELTNKFNQEFNKFKNMNLEIQLFDRLFPVEEKSQKFFTLNYKVFSTTDQLIASIRTVFTRKPRPDQTIQTNILNALQAKKLATHKLLFRYNYLVGIGSKTFFTSHNKGLNESEDTVGIAFVGYKPPFDRVAFVRSDQINKGTLLHELGHLIGGAKDFYQLIDEEENDISDKCTGHDLKIKLNDTAPIKCYKFNDYKEGRDVQNGRGYTGYDFHNRDFVAKPESTMGGSKDLNEQTIDRDTFIKAFNHLKNKPKDPALTLVSGIYANGRLFDAKVSNHGAGMLHPLSTEGDLHIMLKNSSDQMLVETKVPSTFKIETLSSTGGGEHTTSNIVPIVVAFPYQATAAKALIMKKNTDGTNTMVFSKTLSVDTKPNHIFSTNHSYSTVRNFPKLSRQNTVELLKRGANKGASSAWTKFMYSPAFEIDFSYSACSDQNRAGDGMALLLGKDPADYVSNSLTRGNQGVKFNNKGLSLHLDMSGNIYLKNGAGSHLAMTAYRVSAGCNSWKNLKLSIDASRTLTLKERNRTLITHNLTLEQIEEIASQPIGFNAYSKRRGQYRVRRVSVKEMANEVSE